jgi:hypothetical protein
MGGIGDVTVVQNLTGYGAWIEHAFRGSGFSPAAGRRSGQSDQKETAKHEYRMSNK